ncbi:MAG: Gfo/Idh/MocA family oxidoreductase [Armatimonadetes bacterium]|nr:Gfo/Idh/MocA family oxidoreductase [Armatimonadota bacterium]
MRIGIMSMAHMHAYSYAAAINQLDEAEFVGIADHDPARAQECASRFGTRAFGSYADLLAADLDAVVIGSENVRHRELCEMAAAARKHVLCEKPLATTAEDGQAMVAACRASGIQLMTAFPCRFSPAMARLKAAVDGGTAGSVVAIRGTNRGRCPFGWFVDKALSGGGAVIDHTVHVTDLMRWLTGKEVVEVYAETSNRMFGAEFEDIGFLTLGFDGGVFATLDSSWSRPKSFPTWGDVTMNVTCEKGVLSLDMFAQNLVAYSDRTGGVSWIPWGSNIDLLMLRAFVEAVSNGRPVPVTGEDGLRAVEVALAAYRSAEAGQPVSV